jgi:hypothetical protein
MEASYHHVTPQRIWRGVGIGYLAYYYRLQTLPAEICSILAMSTRCGDYAWCAFSRQESDPSAGDSAVSILCLAYLIWMESFYKSAHKKQATAQKT